MQLSYFVILISILKSNGALIQTEKGENVEGDWKQPVKRQAVASDSDLWPNGIVPYVIDARLGVNESKIRDAMNEFQQTTCVRFRLRQANDYDYVYITIPEDNGSFYSCDSKVGKRGGAQYLNLGAGCFNKATIIHELCHAIGIFHEHQRPDRDKYVTIPWDDIPDEHKQNFEKVKEMRIFRNYSRHSVMDYSSYDFSKNNIIVAHTDKDKSIQSYKKAGLAKADIELINELYPRPCL